MGRVGFLERGDVIAVVGASKNAEKWGYKVYRELKSAGFMVYPVNPKHEKIGGDSCYPNLRAIPEKPDVIITVVRPEVTEGIVKECRSLGIGKVWMQPGSESGKAIDFCRKNDIEVMTNACFVVTHLKNDRGE
jgi:predicted CoA-binding protein